jgi:nifR3 family TIM-barrel protein
MVQAKEPLSTKLLKSVSLPGLLIRGNIFLAPIAGWSDYAFRAICTEWGAFFTYTEMVSAEGVVRNNSKTRQLLVHDPDDINPGIQIFTSNPSSAAACIKEISKLNPVLVDLNCGCSIPKVLKSGAGSALLKDPSGIKEIIKAMTQELDVPVTVKLRSGWDSFSVNYLETAAAAVEGGAAMVTLHPRTRTDLFSGKADWDQIKTLKEHLTVPVAGSGDLFSAEDVKRMFNETGCDAVMLARGAMGNPFIFAETIALLTEGERGVPVTAEQRLQTSLKQLRMAIRLKGESTACLEMRKQFCAYTKGLRRSAGYRKLFVHAGSYRDYESIVETYLKEEDQ